MILASMVTHTPVTEYLDMTLTKFFRIFVVICDVMEKRRRGAE